MFSPGGIRSRQLSLLLIWYRDLTELDTNSKHYEQTKMEDRNLVVHGREGVELRGEVIHSIQGLQEVIQRQRLLPSMSQRCGCPDGILDLPAVDIPHRKFPNFLGGECHPDLGQERVPNLRLGRRVEIVEVESDVDTRTEGIVDDLDSVGCEEEDPTVILEMTKAERRRACKRRVVVSRTV